MSQDDLKKKVREYLKNHDTMILATVAADGRPQTAPVFYCQIGFDLYYLSSSDSGHSLNLERDSRAGVTVTDDGQKWNEIQGLQLEGTAGPVDDPLEKARAMTAYLAKFPFTAGLLVKNPGAKTSQGRLYRFTPFLVAMTDNRISFGHREKIRLVGREEGI